MESKLRFDFGAQQAVLRKIAAIDAFQSRWKVEQSDEQVFLRQMKSQAIVESTGSSTRIEGSTLTNIEVESVLKNIKVTHLKSRDEQEVVGYYEVLELVLEQYREIPLSENYIGQLHGMLLRHSVKDQRHRGAYKSLSNQVVATSPEGAQKIIFDTTPPHLTSAAMHELVEWHNRTLGADELHPLLVIAVFVYEFLSIHPFQDGNGRLSRLLTTLLLLQQGYDFIQYTSFEQLIEERKRDYYRSLMDGQQRRGQQEEIITQWVLFFLDCLLTLTQRLTEKRNTYFALKGYLNERQKQILETVKAQTVVQMADLMRIHPLIPRATLKRDMSILVERRLLVQVGKGRGVRYFVEEDRNWEKQP
ncbi:MAG: Fic family protein [Saprospiraceae bacterium]|nr:Fic family protein [Saprospiraceae bacterium]MCC6281371.1 Fic family protein [Saprospiraceae bacterium]